jgi:uncharacterized protein (TIGR00251 family)
MGRRSKTAPDGQAEDMELTETPNGIRFKVAVQPKSSRNLIVGRHGDALKIKLKAPPVDGAANKMLVQYLAKSLKVPKSAVEIVAGHTSRNKQVLVHCPPAAPSAQDRKRLRDTILSLPGKQESS